MSENNDRTANTGSDSRFSGVYSDPKFRETRTKKFKIKLDDRFSKKDLEFKKKAKVDKYGRRIKNQDNKDERDFDKYFEKEEESVEDEEEDPSTKVALLDRARGEVPSDYISSSDEETSSESSSDSEDSALESDESEVEIEDTKPATGDPTKTLAVVNLDWDHVRSEDLMITFGSFVPKGGKILSVAIYPSEFGKERMQREEVEGPPREIFKSKKGKKSQANESDSDVELKDLYEEGDAEKDYDMKSLRRYQLERLRYYYAVVYCNNVATAQSIYKNCDGTEYESTANMFDLRYVPDGMNFDDEPRDTCEEIPKNYTPSQFSTDALQHSKVKLTWDETPADRVQMSKRAFSQKEIDDMDFKAYLASDTDESEEEPNDDMKNKLKALVSESVQIGNKSIFDQTEDPESDVDMEITFTPGLAEATQDKEGSDNEETTIEKVRRKEKERRKKRKERVKELKKKAEEEKKQKTKSKKSELASGNDSHSSEKTKAELELLMMSDDEDDNSTLNKKAHFNMNEIIRSEKEQGKKSKYQKKERIVEDGFKPDLNDPRFSEVFEDHDFAIDPSQPEFKGTAAMKEILKERRKRNKNHSKKRKVENSTGKDNKSELNSLVAKLKRKSHKSERK
ncbi:LAFE_0F03180g1_1 [Lachancea fermentati]|uniref:LAFE_0F03180g1_1 n=1 Tax=Lachancea fermentati TaxID=4955 RepID=A0A1G4MET3_LACFM|nr:LAFE_0F03180g1_1 [Lachancea fermentati]